MLGGVLGHYIQGAVTFKGTLLFSVCGILTVYSKARQFCNVNHDAALIIPGNNNAITCSYDPHEYARYMECINSTY